MKTICVLLNGDIKNDSRVIKVIRTLSETALVDLFYCSHEPFSYHQYFNNHVRCFAVHRPVGFRRKFLRHSLFWDEYNFLAKEALKSTVNYDFVYANDLPCLKPAIRIKQKTGAKVIYDSHEIYIETLNQFFPQKTILLKKLIFKFSLHFMKTFGTFVEKKLLKKTDKFITVGFGLKEYFKNKYKISDIHVVMNFPEIETETPGVDFKSILGLEGELFFALYQGNLNEGRGLRLLIKAIQLSPDYIHCVILGEGVLKKELQKLVIDLGIEQRVHFLGEVTPQMLAKYTHGANVGINLLEPFNLSKALAAPNKLFQYLHAGIPVIASYSYETDIVFRKYKIGYQVQHDANLISQILIKVATQNNSTFIDQCILAKAEYNWDSQAKIFHYLLQ